MTCRLLTQWLVVFCLMQPLSALTDVAIETQSLSLRFSDRGDLLHVEACFPSCAEKDAKTRVISGGQGMLVLEQAHQQELRVERSSDGLSTNLSFVDLAGKVIHQWEVPQDGWVISLKSSGAQGASLMSGAGFRPMPSSGFGYLLEQTRYLIFDDASVESRGLDDTDEVTHTSNDWFGFRNRFWTAMILPVNTTSVTPITGELIEDAQVDFAVAMPGQELELDLYLGPVEPEALAQTASKLEDLMYSGLWFWLRWICQGLYFLLNAIAMVIPHWGLAVMVLSVVVGLLMSPLSKIADRLQDQVHATDARLAPSLAHIKKNYKGEAQSEKILAMYREEKVHPLYSLKSLMGVFVVIPVFIGAFDMLAENIHLSGESFLWIADLSHPDAFLALPFQMPFFGGYLNLLPFIMTGFSFVASRMHSHPAMEMVQQRKHARNLVLMSLGFLILFYTFPAGMVLYWTTNNLISVLKALWKKRKLTPSVT